MRSGWARGLYSVVMVGVVVVAWVVVFEGGDDLLSGALWLVLTVAVAWVVTDAIARWQARPRS